MSTPNDGPDAERDSAATGRHHPDLDRLADYDAGIDNDPELAHHIEGCPECAQRRSALRAVGGELAALPQPPMPPEVAARIHTALSSATAEAATSQPGDAVVDRTIVARRHRRWAGSSLATAAAALVVVALGTAVAINHFRDHGSSSPTNDNHVAAGVNAPVTITDSGRNYTQANLPSALPALLAHNARALAAPAAPNTLDRAEQPAHASTPVPSGGTTGGTAGGTTGGQAKGFASRATAERLAPPALATNPSVLAQCVLNLQGTTQPSPLAVDIGRFQGRQAVVVVLASSTHSDKVDVFVVRPNCPAGSFLFFTRLPRPTAR